MENKVKYLRKSEKHDISQEELAEAIGVSRYTIISIEKGGNTTGEVMLKIANYFNMDPREIFFTDNVAHNLQKKKTTA